MVFETLLRADEAERHPFELFLYAALVTSISVWVAYFIFPPAASLIFLFYNTIALLPIVYKVLQHEAAYFERSKFFARSILQEHWRVIEVYTAIFLGIVVAAAFWFAVLPDIYRNIIFDAQIRETARIGAGIIFVGTFFDIFINNLKVGFISYTMSFFYGTGALFIISWNASILAVWAGKAMSFAVEQITSPFVGTVAASSVFVERIVSIAAHGIPEILAYFIAGIAGGILSVAMIRGTPKSSKIIKDSLALYVASILLVAIGAAVEVWLTPSFRVGVLVLELLAIFAVVAWVFAPAKPEQEKKSKPLAAAAPPPNG